MLLVFFAHTGIIPIYQQPAAKLALNIGYFSLTMFFFMSGYIITTLLRQEFEKTRAIDFRLFYRRRIYRLAPSFFIVLVIAYSVQAVGLLPGETKWLSFFVQLFQGTNYLVAFVTANGLRATGTGLMWSLAVENHFYLFFPALFVFLAKSSPFKKVAQVLIAICLLILIWRSIGFMVLDFGVPWIKHATDSRVDSILAGCAMALWKNPVMDDVKPGTATGYGIAALISCIVAIGVSMLDLNGWAIVLSFSIQSVCLYIIFSGCIMHADSIWFRWLNTRVLVYLGTISYTFYLIHQVINKLWIYNTDLSRPVIAVLAFACTTAFSALMWHYVEKPLNSRRRRMHPERQ